MLRGRFVKRPYIRFSKLRIRRQASAFQVRHARVVEDADPYEAEGRRGVVRIRPGMEMLSVRAARAAGGVGPYDFVSSKTWRFHLIRHPACGRRRMPPSHQGEGFDEDAIAYFCIHMYTKYNYNHNHNPDQIQTQNHPHTHIHPHPHSQTESAAGLLKVLKTGSCPLLLRLAPRSFDSASLRSG